MRIKIDNENFVLNVEKALSSGVLFRPQNLKISLTHEQVETLRVVLESIGGCPSGPRGYCAEVLRRLNEFAANEMESDYNVTKGWKLVGETDSLHFEKLD